MKKRKGRVGASWRLDETYSKVKGIWCYLYRAVDKLGNTVDFLLTRKRQRLSAQSFLIKVISNNYKHETAIGLPLLNGVVSNNGLMKMVNL